MCLQACGTEALCQGHISDLTALSLEFCIELFTMAYLFDPVFSFIPPKRKTWFGEEHGS